MKTTFFSACKTKILIKTRVAAPNPVPLVGSGVFWSNQDPSVLVACGSGFEIRADPDLV